MDHVVTATREGTGSHQNVEKENLQKPFSSFLSFSGCIIYMAAKNEIFPLMFWAMQPPPR
jgi:hypothetical protein